MVVPIGARNTLLTLEEPSETVVNGNATVVWTVRGTAWAKMEGLGGSEGDLSALGNYRFTTGFRRDVNITSRWRLGLKGTERKLQIAAPPQDPDGRRRELVIMATEILA